MKSLVLHFEDAEFQIMKDAKDSMGETWHDLIPVAIAEYYFEHVLTKIGDLKNVR